MLNKSCEFNISRGTYYLLIFLCLYLSSNILHSAPITNLKPDTPYDFVNEVDYLIDSQHILSIDEVRLSNEWQPITKNNINFSFTKDTLWFRFQVSAMQDGSWVMKIPFPLLDNIDVHSFLNYEYQGVIKTGDARVFSARPVDHPYYIFPYKLNESDHLSIYIRIATSGATEVPIKFMPQSLSESENDIQLFLQGWMNGILVVMIFYNLIVYILSREILYLIYTITITAYLFMFAAYNGTAYQYLWPNNPELNSPIFALVNGFFQLSNTVFIITFLNLFGRDSSFKYAFKFLLYSFILLLPLTIIAPYHIIIPIYIILSLILNISGLLVGFQLSFRGDKTAMYFTVAWVFLILNIMISNFRGLGLIPVNWFTLYSYQFSVFIEVTILSIALAQRIETEKESNLLNLKHFEDLYTTTMSGQFTLDKKGILTSANPAFYKMLGYDNLEDILTLSNQGAGRFFHADKSLPDRIFNLLDKIDEAFDLELQLQTKQKEVKWFSVTIRIIRDNNGNAITYEGSMIDIQEQKEHEELKKRAIQERMVAMEHLVVGICHEINTPLGISTTAISHLEEDINLLNESFLNGDLTKTSFSEKLGYEGEAISIIEDNLWRINDLVKNFKDISVLQKGYIHERSTIDKIINEQLIELSSELYDHCIEIECDPNLEFEGYPRAVSDLLHQIIINSLHHAFSNRPSGDIAIHAHLVRDNIEIQFSDNGQGISSEHIRDIFNPFYTTKRGSSGSIGLGLYQVFNIVTQLLEGNIEVENTHPGVRFTITFPQYLSVKKQFLEPNIQLA